MLANALPAAAVADWLLWSLETMPETERIATTAKLKARQKTGHALLEALEEYWRPKTNIDLASAAQCSPGTTTGLCKDGFDIKNKTAERICKIIGIDFKALCKKQIAEPIIKPTPLPVAGAQKTKLLEAAEKLVGTEQESSALEYLQFLLKAKR